MEIQLTEEMQLQFIPKSKAVELAGELLHRVNEGELNPLETLLKLKSVENLLNTILNKSEKDNKAGFLIAQQFTGRAVEEAKKYGKSFEFQGAKFEAKEVGTRYDYSQCNDPEYIRLKSEAEKATEAMKEREKFLQFLPESGLEQVNKETGEAYTIYRPSKSSTTALTVTLK